MSNITLFGNKLPAHIAALAANLPEDHDEFGGGAPALATLSIRGKEFRFRMSGNEQATGMRELEVIMVARRERTSRRYYAGKYASGSNDAPTCHSADGLAPDRGEEKQSETCSTCPHAVYGSKVNDNGTMGFACDSYKMLVVLPFIGDTLSEQPVMLNLPATSIKRSKNAKGNEMHLAEYVTALKQHNVPSIGVVTRIKFTSAEYPQLAFEFVRFAEADEIEAAMGHRDSEDVQAALAGKLIDETNSGNPAAVEAPKEESKPKVAPALKAQKTATVAKPTPVQEAAEAAVEEAASENTDDAMEAVKALLKRIGK